MKYVILIIGIVLFVIAAFGITYYVISVQNKSLLESSLMRQEQERYDEMIKSIKEKRTEKEYIKVNKGKG